MTKTTHCRILVQWRIKRCSVEKMCCCDLAIIFRAFPIKVWRQDFSVKLLVVVLQLITVDKHLQRNRKSKSRESYHKSLFLHSLPYPFQQFALHQGFDHIVGGGEVPGLVDKVHCFETGRERILPYRNRNEMLAISKYWYTCRVC